MGSGSRLAGRGALCRVHPTPSGGRQQIIYRHLQRPGCRRGPAWCGSARLGSARTWALHGLRYGATVPGVAMDTVAHPHWPCDVEQRSILGVAWRGVEVERRGAAMEGEVGAHTGAVA